MKTSFYILVICLSLFGCHRSSSKSGSKDPYLWLENIKSKRSLKWVQQQNQRSEKVIYNYPLFGSLKARFLKVFNDSDKIPYPTLVGDYVYNLWQDQNNQRGVWRRMLTKDYIAKRSNWETVLDIDKLSAREHKKWVFKGAEWLAPDNKVCLITLSDAGKDESVIREFNVESKKFVKNGFFVKQSKGGAAWLDSNTILVSADFGKGTLTKSGYPRIVKEWKRNTPLAKAKTIFKADTSITGGVWPDTFYANGKWHYYIDEWITAFKTALYNLSEDTLRKVNFPADAEVSGFYRNELILNLQSDWVKDGRTFPQGSLVSFDVDKSMKNNAKVKIIYQPDKRSSFVSMESTKDFIVVNTMDNVQNRLAKYQLKGNIWEKEEIKTPEFGSIFLETSSNTSDEYFFRYSNLITPTTLIYGNDKGTYEVKKLKAAFKTDNLEVQQHEATSKDGTKIPYFIVHKRDMILNGKNPTLVYGYGGFNISLQPHYSVTRGIGWMELGGVYVLANIRGGGEFGPSWHKAAMKEKRQNAYDDFFAVTEDLIKRKITSPKYLGAFGWSNGGLLAGVALTERPDLYNAIVIGAPLLDMKRYTKMFAGASWIGEYGDPDNPKDWAYLKKYSPYQNVYKGKKYPEPLFITSISDDRVDPAHARKMAAKMMGMGYPVLYHETLEGGHGAASTNNEEAAMWATVYTYLNMKLNKKATEKN